MSCSPTADPVPKDEAKLLDAMIENRLAAQGKTLIDAGRIDRLRPIFYSWPPIRAF